MTSVREFGTDELNGWDAAAVEPNPREGSASSPVAQIVQGPRGAGNGVPCL